jgi:hypothetical protein
MEGLLDTGEEFNVLSFVEGAHYQGVRGVIVEILSSKEGDRLVKMAHNVTSGVFG